MARRRGRIPGGHIWKEWEHPRDERGRFAKVGAEAWARKAVAKAAHYGQGAGLDINPGHRPGEGPKGRLPGGLLVNTPKREKLDPEIADLMQGRREGGRLQPIGEAVGDSGAEQIRVGGRWRVVVSRGSGGGQHALGWQDPDTGEVGQVVQAAGPVMVRPAPAFQPHAELNGVQRSIMDTRLKLAQQTPQFRIPEYRNPTEAVYQRELDEAKAELAEATRKAKRRAARGFPKSDGPGYQQNRQSLVDRLTGDAQWKVERAQMFLDSHLEQRPAVTQKVGDTPAEFTGELDHEHPLGVYGDMLHIESQDQAAHRSLNDLSSIPAPLHTIVAAEMFRQNAQDRERSLPSHAGIYVGSTGVDNLDHMSDLKGKDPGGGWAGRSWSEIDGVFQGYNFSLVVGHTANADHKHEGAGRHEFGHALDEALGRARSAELTNNGLYSDADRVGGGVLASSSARWRELYARAAKAGPLMNPYFLQSGDTGPVEMWAEAFAVWAEAYHKERQRYIRDHKWNSGFSVSMRARHPDAYRQQQEDSAMNRAARALSRKFRFEVGSGLSDETLTADMAAYFKQISDAAGVDWSA